MESSQRGKSVVVSFDNDVSIVVSLANLLHDVAPIPRIDVTMPAGNLTALRVYNLSAAIVSVSETFSHVYADRVIFIFLRGTPLSIRPIGSPRYMASQYVANKVRRIGVVLAGREVDILNKAPATGKERFERS